jgi:hypothetical protein
MLIAATSIAIGPFDASLAWTRPGHMVIAAIAYDDLQAQGDLQLIDAIGAMLERHPDRGPFEVAIDREIGASRIKRMFFECARWPDDARGTQFDHPTWHAALSPVNETIDAPAAHQMLGEADEAFALSVRTLTNEQAPMTERALALCWVMHLSGDVHQPLHTAQIQTPALPDGDRGGGLLFVKDHLSNDTISLHWFWDDLVHRSGDPDAVVARAKALERQYSRNALIEDRAVAANFPQWRAESLKIAKSIAYAPGFPGAVDKAGAQPVPNEYLRAAQPVTERRVTMAGYRLADVLREALGGHH